MELSAKAVESQMLALHHVAIATERLRKANQRMDNNPSEENCNRVRDAIAGVEMANLEMKMATGASNSDKEVSS